MLPDDDGDLHIPHYIDLFGGTVFLEPLSRFEEPLRKAFAANGGRHDDHGPRHGRPGHHVKEAARLIHETGHNRLPVVEGGRLVGVVTRLDLLGALTAVSVVPRGRSHASTSARSSATARGCRGRRRAVRGRQGGRLRPRRGPGRRARRSRAARRGSRSPRPRGGRAARRRDREPAARDGRADARTSCARRSRPDADVVAWTRGASAASAAAPRRAREARHRHGPARHEGPRGWRCGSPPRRRTRSA